MTDLEELRWLFRIDRADRAGLLAAIEELRSGDLLEQEPDIYDAEQMRYLKARASVDSVEAMLEAARTSSGKSGAPTRGGRRTRTATIDLSGYHRDREYLSEVDSDSATRKRLREAAERRLSHFDKRDGYFYHRNAKTPLEAYCDSLSR